MKITNPVLTGFHADPSIIRVGDTYYIANSTFEWFPGVRIHRSTDMVHWELMPSPLTSKTGLNLAGDPSSGGVWAPDLSYADGKYWLVYSDVKVVEGAFRDVTNYLTTAQDIAGPWTTPLELNGVGFDASLFHDQNGRKYLVQQTWDHREYRNSFNGITLTEFDTNTMKLIPSTARTIYLGTAVKVVEGPHIYQKDGYYYLFAAQGGTTYEHQEVVARSKSLDELSFETEPGEPFITNFDTPYFEIQKQGHGSLVDTPSGEWYYASLCARPWHRKNESINSRGWSSLGRETSIQKVMWDVDGWPRIVGGHGGQVEVDAPEDAKPMVTLENQSRYDDFIDNELDLEWNTLREPFNSEMGKLEENQLKLVGRHSLSSNFGVSMVASRWQDFYFSAETKVKFNPFSYQQMAGLVNYYNTAHWSWIFITNDEKKGRVIEIAENNQGNYRSYLRENSIPIPEKVDYVWFKTVVSKQTYRYEYSFDGDHWRSIPVDLDAAVLSDDYVLQTYGGFFTGAFVGLAAVDYSGYKQPALFDYFSYKNSK